MNYIFIIIIIILFGISIICILNYIAYKYLGFRWYAPKKCENFTDIFSINNAVYFDKIVDCKFKKFIAILDNFPSYFCILKTSSILNVNQYNIYANSEAAKIVYLSIASRIGLPFKEIVVSSTPKKPYIWAVMFDKDEIIQQIGTDLSVDYSSTYNPDIFRLTFPYSYLSGIALKSGTILKLLTFPNIIYTCASTIPKYMKVPQDMQVLIDQHSIEHDTYFSALGFSALESNELFAEYKKNISYTPSQNIDGTLINIKDLYKRFVLNTTDIEGVYPIINDQITLINQTKSNENDTYIVTDHTVLETAEYVDYYNSSWTVDYTDFVERKVFLKRPSFDGMTKFTKIYFNDLKKPAIYTDDTHMHAMIYDPDFIFDKASECVTDLQIKTRAECESTASGLWDRRCVIDSECPFFTENGKGGCENGYCMMPTGVQRVGYKKYLLGKESYPRKHANGIIAFPLDFTDV